MTWKLTRNDQESHLAVIWEGINYEGEHDEKMWNEICTAMAWVREDLGLCSELEWELAQEANNE